MYLSGARGINADYIYPTSYTGFGNNALSAPDTNHILYSGAATTKGSMIASDKMVVATVDRLIAKATMMGGGTTGIPQIQPIDVDGEEHYVLVMSPWDEYNMRASAATAGSWMDIQKAAATAEGRNNPIFKGGLGMINNVVLHKHKSVIRFSDYGSGAVLASRSLFMGTQAAVCAFGSPGTGLRYDWNEETRDNGNQAVITTGTICGMKKTSFTIAGVSMDFGVIAVDSAAADPG